MDDRLKPGDEARKKIEFVSVPAASVARFYAFANEGGMGPIEERASVLIPTGTKLDSGFNLSGFSFWTALFDETREDIARKRPFVRIGFAGTTKTLSRPDGSKVRIDNDELCELFKKLFSDDAHGAPGRARNGSKRSPSRGGGRGGGRKGGAQAGARNSRQAAR